MGGLEQAQGLSLGILIDIVDEQWMRDTLPAEGACRAPPHFPSWRFVPSQSSPR
jgi:hypothetical protein